MCLFRMSNEIKQMLSNSFLFLTFTGVTHYIISKYLISEDCLEDFDDDFDKEADNKIDNIENNNKKTVKEYLIPNEENIIEYQDQDQEKRKKIIQKKEELEDLYLKLIEIKSLIQNIHNNKN